MKISFNCVSVLVGKVFTLSFCDKSIRRKTCVIRHVIRDMLKNIFTLDK